MRRAIAILRLLAAAGRRGYPLTELAKRSGLPHPTVHRILKQLIAERVAYQSNITGRYGLGELTHELGLAAAEQHDLERLCRPELARLAESVGDTVYLVTRAGSDALCVDRFEGPWTERAVALDVGTRRPLGSGAGGLAILAALTEAQRTSLLGELAVEGRMKEFTSFQTLLRNLDLSRHRGYSLIRNQVTPGVSAVGLRLCDAQGRPVGAVSIAGTHQRLNPARIPTLVSQLTGTVQRIESAHRQKITTSRGRRYPSTPADA